MTRHPRLRRAERTTPIAPLAVTTVLLALLGMLGPFSIDTTFPAFQAMGSQFDASEASMQLVVSTYLFAFGLMSLFHGPISDAVGRKPVMIAGVLIYALASIGCAFSPSLPVLLGFRVLQGMSAGAGTIVSRTVVRDLFEGPAAQRLMSTVAMIFGLGPAIAPILGGALLLFGPWPLIFWFLTLYGVVIAIAVLVLLPESHPPELRTPVNIRAILGGVGRVARRRSFQVLSAASAFSFAGQFLYIADAPIFVVTLLAKGAQDFWVFFVPMVIAMITGSFTNGRLAERVTGTSSSSPASSSRSRVRSPEWPSPSPRGQRSCHGPSSDRRPSPSAPASPCRSTSWRCLMPCRTGVGLLHPSRPSPC